MVENEVETRKLKQTRIAFHLAQRQAELDRYSWLTRLAVYADSLEKVKQEQLAFIDSLGKK